MRLEFEPTVFSPQFTSFDVEFEFPKSKDFPGSSHGLRQTAAGGDLASKSVSRGHLRQERLRKRGASVPATR